MAFSIAKDICEGIGDCTAVCPTESISWGEGFNKKGTSFAQINPDTCSSCAACLSVCPIERAIQNNRASNDL